MASGGATPLMIALYLDGEVQLDASLHDIEAAIGSLDGAEHSLAVVELPSRKTITVGGGPTQFVAEVADEGGRWCVIDAGRSPGTIDLVIGGEAVTLPARLGVDRDAALEAVRTFVSESGARSARLAWSAER